MSSHRAKGFAVFLASACVSLVVLGSCLLLFLLYMKAAQAEAIKNDVTVPIPYTPDPSEDLQMLTIGSEAPEDLPELLLLWDYDAAEGELTVIGIPSRTVCVWNGRRDTLAGHYSYEGVRGVLNGVNTLFGVHCDRYMRASSEGIASLIDWMGGVEYVLDAETVLGGRSLSEGTHLFDGRQTAGLLLYSEPLPDVALQTRLAALAAQQKLDRRMADRYGGLTEAFFASCETNLSQYDFLARERGLCRWMGEGLKVHSYVLDGAYSLDEFTPSPDSVRTISQSLGEGA